MKHLRAKLEAVRQPIDPAAEHTTELNREFAVDRPTVQIREVSENEAGQRLDHFLVRICKAVPKSHLYRVIRSGEVRVNGKRARGELRLAAADIVRIPPIWLQSSQESLPPVVSPGLAKRLTVLLEDEHLIVINKPEGVAVHGGSGVSSGVIEQMRAARPQTDYLELVHRIDKETSGILLIAKKRSSLVHLQSQFSGRTISKNYRAIVIGKVPKRTKTLDGSLLIRVSADGHKSVSVKSDGLPAITRITGLKEVAVNSVLSLSLVNAKIETGRTHQIRVHAAHQQWPILGDEKYGNFELNKLLSKTYVKRMFLHAFSIEFYHPLQQGPSRKIYLEAPLPASFLSVFPDQL
jgi:23S rRNA pseudouridine955/2504/2580 synthase